MPNSLEIPKILPVYCNDLFLCERKRLEVFTDLAKKSPASEKKESPANSAETIVEKEEKVEKEVSEKGWRCPLSENQKYWPRERPWSFIPRNQRKKVCHSLMMCPGRGENSWLRPAWQSLRQGYVLFFLFLNENILSFFFLFSFQLFLLLCILTNFD